MEKTPTLIGGVVDINGAPHPPIDSDVVASVLAEIAEIASETLELQDVFGRIANAVRRIVPLEEMSVVRVLDGGDRAVLHATTLKEKESKRECIDIPLSAWSPRWRPRPESNRIDDAPHELDPEFMLDAHVLESGLGCGLWEPFRRGETFAGGVWLCSSTPHAFMREHQDVLRPIAALLGSAVEHWRLWDIERRRQLRLDQVENVLATLAQSLDVREIFQRLSDEIQPILPHKMMALTELDVRDRTMRIAAFAGKDDPPTSTVQLTPQEIDQRIDFVLVQDIPAQITPDTERQRLIISSGMRSWLRVPVMLTGEVKGGLSFFHDEPARYGTDDAEVARRLADRIALSMSLHRLAEEARQAAAARESADRLAATVQTLTRELESRTQGRVVGVSRSWKDTLVAVSRVAPSETTALITGESGTGKEVIAKLIHQGSSRHGKPLIAINCAALPEQLLESELFGHEKGAFTGAVATKIGRIEQAAGGTLFLDEIAEMSPIVQAKLLRVLEERKFQRVGGTRTLDADVRIVTATNRDLAAGIARGAFRDDLYYRLNVFQIHISPLRERREDILPLAEAFLEDLGRTMGRPAAGISRDSRDWLLTYRWPGNVRELRNAIERAILLCDGGLITRDHLPTPLARTTEAQSWTPVFGVKPASDGNVADSAASNGEDLNLDTVERGLLEKALAQSKGNKSRAARILGVTRAQLYWRLEKHGLR